MIIKDYECPRKFPCGRPDLRCDKVVRCAPNRHFMASVNGGEFFATCPLSKALDGIRAADVNVSSVDGVNFYNKDMQHVGVAE